MNLNKLLAVGFQQKAQVSRIQGDVGHYYGFMNASEAFLNLPELDLNQILRKEYSAKYIGDSIKNHAIQLLTESEEMSMIGYNVSNPHKHYTKRSEVLELINPLTKYLESMSVNYQFAGSYRRQKEYVGDLDILIIDEMIPKTDLDVMCTLTAYGPKKAKLVFEGLEVDIRSIESKSFPCAIQYYTGSRDHNLIIRSIYKSHGFKLNEYCITDRISGEEIYPKSESEIYSFIGQAYVDPVDR